MDADDDALPDDDSSKLVHLAENASALAESKLRLSDDHPSSSKIESTRPPRPTILTQTQSSASIDDVPGVSNGHTHLQDTVSSTAVDGTRSTQDAFKWSHSPSRSLSSGKDDSDSVAISPMLRKYTIPISERSPTETLPAMHNAPQSSSSKSPSSQQNLPSLRAIALEPLLDGRSPKETTPHGINRHSFPLGTGTLNPTSVTSTTPRPVHFPGSQTRMNGQFNPGYSHGHPSPAYSDASPKDRDSANMSPPTGKPAPQSFYPNGRTPQSEELTPQSAESHHSSSSFSTVPSPHPHQMEIDRSRPTLPPLAGLPAGSLVNGSFKCGYNGCTAAPFQTQYLLK